MRQIVFLCYFFSLWWLAITHVAVSFCDYATLLKPFNCSLPVLSLSFSKPFHCWLPVLSPFLSLSLAVSIHWFAQSYCEATNATTTMLRLLLLYQFWLAEIGICHKPRPTKDETHDLQIALPRILILPFFFYTSGTLYARQIHACFKLWGRPFCLSLLASFFPLVLLWKEFNSHSFIVTFHFSCSFGWPPVFYPAGASCWIHINIGCSTCIYSTPLVVSLNNELRLAHRRQQSVGSAFQFRYIFPTSFFFLHILTSPLHHISCLLNKVLLKYSFDTLD